MHNNKLPKSFLTGSIPNLKFDFLTRYLNYSGSKLNTDSVRTICHN